jgi:hypothetical protein
MTTKDSSSNYYAAATDATFVRALAWRLFRGVWERREVLNGRPLFPQNAMDVQGGFCEAEDLREACGEASETFEIALALPEDAWQWMADEINGWSLDYWQKQPEYRAANERRSALAYIERRLAKLPPMSTIERQLGTQKAEIYREALEEIENSERWGCLVDFVEENNQGCLENEQVMRLVCTVAEHLGDEDGLVQEFETWREQKKRASRQQRARVEDKNARIREAVRALGMWLPNPAQYDKWRREEGGEEFVKLAERCGQAMRRQKCVLQFVPRRNHHPPNVRDMPRNAKIMREYLGDPG